MVGFERVGKNEKETYLIEYKKAVTANDEYEDDNAGVLRWYALLNTLNQYDMGENDDDN